MSRRTWLGTAIAAGGGLVATSCRTSHRSPDTLTVLINAAPEHLDPRYPGDALGATISRLVFAGLLASDRDTFLPRPDLADRVELVDTTRVIAHLRDDRRFHDGTPLTSEDVVATFRGILDPQVGSTLRNTYARAIAGVEAIDRRTVAFTLTGPDGTYGSLLEQPIVRARDATHREYAADPGNEGQFVGAGAMRVVSLERGAWELERVVRIEGKPRRVRFFAMRDPNTFALRLLHGDADLGEIKPELFPLFTSRRDFEVANAHSVGFTYLGIRNEHPLLAHVEVRHAIAHAIDRAQLRRGKLGAYSQPATGPLPPGHWAYEPGLADYPFDPTLSRSLLAPFLRGGRERLVMRTTNVRFVGTVARAIAAMLADVGLDVEIRQSDPPALFADLRGARFDLTLMTAPDFSDPWGLAWMFASTSIPTPADPFAGGNRWRYRNRDLDALLERGRTALTPETRRPHYVDAQRILASELPVVPLWHADLVFAAGPRITNVHPRGDNQWDFLLDVDMRRG
jgi:peptide/nickel transport system substrate-binding protein